MNKILLIVYLATFLSCGQLITAAENVIIDDYSYKDGLNTSWVYSVYKDSKGFLWICSNNGLFRYDGYNFRNLNTLVKDFFNLETFCITEDPDNNFFIGTKNGIYYYNTHTHKVFPIRLALEKNCMVYQILLLDNNLWVASNIGLLRIDKQKGFSPDHANQTRIFLPDSLYKRTPQDNIVNALYFFPGYSALWVGTNGALYELDLKTLTFQLVNSFSQNSIRHLSKYANSIIASSWDGGVFLVNPSTRELENDPFIKNVNKILGDKRVMSAFTDSQNLLWVATFGNGLYIFKKNESGTLSYENYKNDQSPAGVLKSDFINQMYIDNTGIVWLSQIQPALSKVYFQKSNLRIYNFYNLNKDLDLSEIRSVNQSSSENKLWVATNGSGICLFDLKSHTLRQFNDKTTAGLRLQSNKISFCYQDRKGNLWIVYQRMGLYVVPSGIVSGLLDGSIKTMVKAVDANMLATKDSNGNSYITTIFDDSSGRLWFGGWGSLYMTEFPDMLSDFRSLNRILSASKTISVITGERQDELDFPISPVTSLAELIEHKFLLGTLGSGIIQVEENPMHRFSLKQLDINKKIPTDNARLVYKDSKNNVWIGTHSGLYYWDLKSDSLRMISSKNGLCSDDINNIVEDGNSNIWVSTSYGISVIQTGDFTITNYFYTDKQKYNQYIMNAGNMTHDGLVYFSTNESMVFINPDSIETNSFNPPLYFTDIKIDNKTVIPLEKYYGTLIIESDINECKEITVPYNHTLSLEFAALDFINSGKFNYKYRIGSDNEWIVLNANQRSLVIPNLKHGEYSLNIMLADSPNENNIRSIKINYLPPFWLTTYAYIIYGIIILFLLLTYRRLLTQKILQKSILEKERFERRKVEELDKMKSEFFSNISHEFRTPLSLIINPLEKLAKDEEITNKNKEKINLILKSSNRLLKLTNELMDFSKIEKKLLVPDFQLYDIVALVHELCRLFNNVADSMDLDFKIICSYERLEIPVDKRMIEKVIFNLLSNAFKYTPAKGMIMVNINKSQETEREFIKISVINTGAGIENEDLQRIFDRYYQVSNVQNRSIQGTGIGLALVKSYVELHNGKVEVKSEPGLETCFDIVLPVIQEGYDSNREISIKSADKKLKNGTASQENKSQIVKPLAHYRLLIIEDEEDIRNYMIEELSPDFEISYAQNGEEGLNMANEIIPDLIITDVLMPVLSGLELCRKLKNQVITSHIPVLMLSAKATTEAQIEGLETGADVYMIKPFSIDHLKAQIMSLISFKQAIYLRYRKETTLIPHGALTTKLDEEFMKKVMNFIEENLTNSDLSVDQLAHCVSLSKVQTYRKIKAISGLSIVEFIRTIRLKKAAQMILEGRLSFSEISFETGFSTPSYFSKCFHDHFGKTPSEFAMDSVGK